jgi:hypothetical protein
MYLALFKPDTKLSGGNKISAFGLIFGCNILPAIGFKDKKNS